LCLSNILILAYGDHSGSANQQGTSSSGPGYNRMNFQNKSKRQKTTGVFKSNDPNLNNAPTQAVMRLMFLSRKEALSSGYYKPVEQWALSAKESGKEFYRAVTISSKESVNILIRAILDEEFKQQFFDRKDPTQDSPKFRILYLDGGQKKGKIVNLQNYSSENFPNEDQLRAIAQSDREAKKLSYKVIIAPTDFVMNYDHQRCEDEDLYGDYNLGGGLCYSEISESDKNETTKDGVKGIINFTHVLFTLIFLF
jgi:hypothetical protein